MGSPELRAQRAQEGNALDFPTWSPALPLSGLSFPLRPGTEQTLRDRVVMNLDSLYLKRHPFPTLGAASRWPGHRRRSFDSPVLYPSAFSKFPKGLSTPNTHLPSGITAHISGVHILS